MILFAAGKHGAGHGKCYPDQLQRRGPIAEDQSENHRYHGTGRGDRRHDTHGANRQTSKKSRQANRDQDAGKHSYNEILKSRYSNAERHHQHGTCDQTDGARDDQDRKHRVGSTQKSGLEVGDAPQNGGSKR